MSIYLSDENKKLKKLAGRLNTIDNALDPASTNPVQNKTLYNPVTFAESERQKSETDGEIVHKNELDTTNINLDSFSRGYNNFRDLTFDSWDSVKDWVQNEAPVGSYIKYINLHGFWTIIIQKTSSQYASIVRFWYENNLIQKCRLYAGNWSDFEDV